MRHYAYECPRCGKVSNNKQCFCNLLDPTTIEDLKSFLIKNNVNIEDVHSSRKGLVLSPCVDHLWMYTSIGRIDLPYYGGMGITNDKIHSKFNKFCDQYFKSKKIELSKRFVVKINGEKKVIYGIDKDEVRREAEAFVLKNTSIIITS